MYITLCFAELRAANLLFIDLAKNLIVVDTPIPAIILTAGAKTSNNLTITPDEIDRCSKLCYNND